MGLNLIIMAMNVVIDMLNNIKNRAGADHKARRKRRIAGFTMAELLIVVAIIGVLAGVSFIAVQSHQRSVTQLQYDTIAKEIFVAAQNHLTLAKSENYGQDADLSKKLDITIGGKDFFGADGNASADGTTADIRYFYSDDDNTSTALDQILPFGAVELVTGGKFIIRYQPIAARVLDVFYWTSGDSNYDAALNGSDYSTLVGTTESASDRHQNYKGSGLLGWCGGEDIVESGVYLVAPEVDVINKEMLLVKVTDKNIFRATDGTADILDTVKPQLKLLITGSCSGAKVAIPLNNNIATTISNGDRVEYDSDKGQYTIVLDDITTSGLHFSELKTSTKKPAEMLDNKKAFIPGENIIIQAVAYSNAALASVAYSGEWTANSLFGEVTENTTTIGSVTTTTAGTVKISNIRHLANLNDSLSDAGYSDNYFGNAVSAVQTVDLDWTTFKTGVNTLKKATDNPSVSLYDKKGTSTKADCFLPVSVPNTCTLSYNGQSDVIISETTETEGQTVTTQKTIQENHSIKGLVVDIEGANSNGGVFGALTGATIKNLELIDTSVKLASGNAGALAGTLTGTTVTNVVAHHSDGKKDTAKITTASGSAGGLIGSATSCTIQKSAAALIVSSTSGNAGGLIGTTDGGTVSACYSGGHAIEKKNNKDEVIGVIYDEREGQFNVTASAAAGGLIGDAGSAEISNSYSTCSATGAKVGGFVGTASGTISNSYCTGKVSGTAQGAFAAECTGNTTNCNYFEIVNEYAVEALGYDYLTALPKTDKADGNKEGITALDASADTYNEFTKVWSAAEPYLKASLMNYYGEGTGTARVAKYNLKNVEQLIGGTDPLKDDDDDTTDYFVSTHHGDWPAPEVFVVNTANSGS